MVTNLRSIPCPGAEVYVGVPQSMSPTHKPAPGVRFIVITDDPNCSLTLVLSPSKARELAQALTEFALAAEQAAAPLVAPVPELQS